MSTLHLQIDVIKETQLYSCPSGYEFDTNGKCVKYCDNGQIPDGNGGCRDCPENEIRDYNDVSPSNPGATCLPPADSPCPAMRLPNLLRLYDREWQMRRCRLPSK